MPPNGQPGAQRSIPYLDTLPRPLYARAESLGAGSWTPRHRHDWVQFSYAISGVLGVHTDEGSFFAPPQWGIWIPAGLEHEVITSMRAEMRSLYVRREDCQWAPDQCRVLEVTPLARELIRRLGDSDTSAPFDERLLRFCAVLLDEVEGLSEAPLNLPGGQVPQAEQWVIVAIFAAIATAGSCFAQHVGRALRGAGMQVQDAEPRPRGCPQGQGFDAP